MSKRWLGRAAGVLALAVWGGTAPAIAQSLPDAARDAAERQQQNLLLDEEMRRQVERRHREAPSRRPPSIIPGPQEVAPVTGDGPCVDVATIAVEDATLVPRLDLREAVAPFEGRCLTTADIEGIIRALTNLYVDGGWVAARVYVPEQDLAGDVLRVVVLEGTVEDLKVAPDRGGPRQSGALEAALPGLVGEPLNLRDLEQGIDQLNRLKSNDAAVDLRPGSGPGDTVVAVTGVSGVDLRGSIVLDNTGSRATGENQATAVVEADNMLGAAESLGVSVRRTLPEGSSKMSESVSGYAVLPFGYWTVSGSIQYFAYRTTVESLNTQFKSSGMNRAYRLQVDRVVHRDSLGKTTLSGALNHSVTRNYLEDTLLPSGTRKLSVVEARIAHDRRLLGGVAGGAITWHRGIKALGALDDAAPAEDELRAQFSKVSLDLSWYRPLPVALPAGDLSWSTFAHGQWSGDTLFGSERIGIGGPSSVRGFKEESVSGDIGGYMRNELVWTAPGTGIGMLDRTTGTVRAFAGWDIGWLAKDNHDAVERGVMQGAAVGLQTSGPLALGVTVGHALEAPHFISEEGQTVVSLSAAISF